MPEYLYPTPTRLQLIDAEIMDQLTFNDPIFARFPMVPVDSHVLIWEQRDNFTGLMQARGLNGEPPRALLPGLKRFVVEPAVFGEFILLDEMRITQLRRAGTLNEQVDVRTMVLEAQQNLRHRHVQRVRQILWNLCTYGWYKIYDHAGTEVATDVIPLRTYSPLALWSSASTATPLADFRNVQLLGRGAGSNFGSGAQAFMNQVTANYMLSNTNAADLYGRRSAGLSTLNTMQLVNQLWAGEGLPVINVYDDGYQNDSNAFVNFIPDGYVIVFGRRDTGERIGQFSITRNANTSPPGQPAPYAMVNESTKPPKTIRVDSGFNGAPEVHFGNSIVVMKVA